jgi:hypothetical protein
MVNWRIWKSTLVISLSNVSLGAKKCGNHCTMAAYRLGVEEWMATVIIWARLTHDRSAKYR